MRFRLIDAKKAELPIERMCMLLHVSASGYYAWRRRGPSRRQLDDMVLLAHIRARFGQSNGTYGSPRMHVDLRKDGLAIGRHRTARLMAPQILRVRRTSRPDAGAVAVDVMGRQGEAGTEGADDALQALEELLAGPVDLG